MTDTRMTIPATGYEWFREDDPELVEKLALLSDLQEMQREANADRENPLRVRMRQVSREREIRAEARREALREAIEAYQKWLLTSEDMSFQCWLGEMVHAEPETEENTGDEKYREAIGLLFSTQRASTSFLSRELKIPYSAAVRLMDRAQKEGLVTRPNSVGKREVNLSIAALIDAPAPAPAQPSVQESALKKIANMKPHHAGQTPNEYHMQQIAKKALIVLEDQT